MTITLDLTSLVLSSIVIFFALLTPLMSPLFRRLKHDEQPASTNPLPPVTILLVSNGDHQALDEHLPNYLTQTYEPGYEVVVVSEKADLETENVLKRYSQDPKLYHTFVPDTSRYMSKNKLAITLGVKAAKNDWIVLTDPRCKPADSHWISSLARSLGSDKNLVLGYSNYSDEAKAHHRFEQLHTSLYLLRHAQGGKAFRTNCHHVSFRKSEFMNRNGFLEYLKYSIGEYDFLVNKFSEEGKTAVATEESTWLWENPIMEKTWQNRRVYFHEVGKHLEGGGSIQVVHAIDTIALHLTYLLILATCIYAGVTMRWILLGASIVAFLVTTILRTLNGKKALQLFKVKIPAWKIVPLELGLLRHSLFTRMRYEYTDKNDFISHKI